METKKTTKKATAKAAVVETEVKETKKCVRKCATKKAETVNYNAEIAGTMAGIVWETLAAAEKALTIAEIVKMSKKTEAEVLLGMGWLLREGKLTCEEGKVTLA